MQHSLILEINSFFANLVFREKKKLKYWTECIAKKVAKVVKLTQTVRELEEAVLAGGAAANAVRDYQRKVQEMNVIYPLLDFPELYSKTVSIWTKISAGIFICIYFPGRKKNS